MIFWCSLRSIVSEEHIMGVICMSCFFSEIVVLRVAVRASREVCLELVIGEGSDLTAHCTPVVSSSSVHSVYE
jgi:hypothetical protein